MDAAHAFSGLTVTVFGASGFLGQPLVRRLALAGARVIAVSRSVAACPDQVARVELRQADGADAAQVHAIFESSSPDVVFQFASESRGGRELDIVSASIRNDFLVTAHVLVEAARRAPRMPRVVLAGSLEEPLPGESTPVSPYAAAKWAASTYGRMFRELYDVDVRIVRPMMTYGPGQKHYKVVPDTILRLLRNERIRVRSSSRLVDWIFVDDVVDGMLRAAAAPALSATVDLGSGVLTTVGECVKTIARLLGKETLVDLADERADREIVRAADVESAYRAIGCRAATSLVDGLGRTIDWYRSHVRGGSA